MPRTHGYSLKGERCYGRHDWHAKCLSNVIGALLEQVLLSSCLFNCTIDSDVFHTWVVEDLLPKTHPGSVIVMDNATFHKQQDIRQAIEEWWVLFAVCSSLQH